ncbi:LamG-like jellyroll fold domain-containing protein [Aquimarina longa]|uniref:LamG-like jellyroll fold domain-containing protein n=1 Tax=Aquimarina longa TaxID=1080221 RepID=UPI0007849B88|nr:LamG-like jellyroll fold domain-containing protein [Aquimarina longa]
MKKISKTLIPFAISAVLMFTNCSKDDDATVTVVTTISTKDVAVSINENPQSGARITKVSGTANQGKVTFKLKDEKPSGALSINTTSGELTVKNKALFDFETNPSITAVVEVSTGDASKNAKITITLNDVKIPQNGLVGYYKLEGDVVDDTANNNGTMNALTPANDRNDKTGKALNFSEAGVFAGLGDVMHFAGEDKQFAISFWMKPTTFVSNSTIVSKLSQNTSCGENEQEFILRIKDGKIAPVYYGNTTNAYRGFRGETDVQLDQWYHVVLNYDGTVDTNDGTDRIKIFLNGATESFTANESGGTFPFDIEDTASHLGLGNRLNSNGEVCSEVPFIGILDDMAFYDRTLGVDEVKAIWEDNF